VSAPVDYQTRRSLVGRNMIVLFGSQAVTWILALVLTIAEPRYLGPDGIGQLRLGLAVWSVANVVADLGLHTLLTLEFARSPGRANALLGPAIRLRAAAELMSIGVVMVFMAVAGYDLETSVTITIVGIGLIVRMFAELARSALYGIQWMAPTARADIIAKFVLVALVVGVLVAGAGAHAVAAVMIVPALLRCALLWRSLNIRRREEGWGDGDPVPARSVVRRGSPYLLGSAVQQVYGGIDLVVISLVASLDEIGWYAAAATLFGSLLFIPTTFTTTLFPALAQLHVERPDAMHDLLARSVRSSFLVTTPICIGTVAIATPICVALLGDEFRNSGPVLAVFGVVLLFMFLTILFGSFAFATERHKIFNVTMIIACLLTIPLDIVLIPWTNDRYGNGAIGGAIAYVLTEAFILTIVVWKLAPHIVDRPMVVRVLKCVLAGGALFAVSWPLRDQFLAVPIVAGAITYLLAVIVLRIPDEEERHMLRRLVQRLRDRTRPRHVEPIS